MVQGAPDLALTQLLVETLGTVAFVLVLRHLPEGFTSTVGPTRKVLPAVIGVAVALFVFYFTITAGSISGTPTPDPDLAGTDPHASVEHGATDTPTASPCPRSTWRGRSRRPTARTWST